MRIVLASQSYPPLGAGGIATQTRLKARGLAAMGHEVIVATHGHDRREETAEDGFRVVRLADPGASAPIPSEAARWLAYSEALAEEIDRLDRQLSLDIVEFPEWAAEGYVFLERRREKRPAAVVHVHGPLVMLARTIGWPALDSDLYRTGRVLERACLTRADEVYSSSACSMEWCASEHGIDTSAWQVLHAGVDTRRFAPGPVERDARPTIAFVGRIAASKGADILVDACLRLAAHVPDLRLRMMGSGEAGHLRSLEARAAAVPGLLELAGPVSGDDLPAELRRADVFAAPSLYEGGPGFVYLEAMACGLPVVACSGSGTGEAVAEDCGVFVPAGRVEPLADALGHLLRDGDLRSRMGQRGRERALEVDTVRAVERIAGLYARTLDRVEAERSHRFA